MTKKEIKQLLIQVRNQALITPILEKIWQDYHDHEILVNTILETKEAREDYKAGRVYAHEEVFTDKEYKKKCDYQLK